MKRDERVKNEDGYAEKPDPGVLFTLMGHKSEVGQGRAGNPAQEDVIAVGVVGVKGPEHHSDNDDNGNCEVF